MHFLRDKQLCFCTFEKFILNVSSYTTALKQGSFSGWITCFLGIFFPSTARMFLPSCHTGIKKQTAAFSVDCSRQMIRIPSRGKQGMGRLIFF